MRIAIFGRPGSGKSTFASELAAKLDIPLHHLDKLFFTADWQERPHDDFLLDQQKIVAAKDWIIDGNSLKSLGLRYMNADVVIYFYLPMHLCLFRVLKRLCYRDPKIDDRADNCPEKIDWKLVKYMWNLEAQAQVRGRLDYLRSIYPNVSFYKIHSDKEARKLMRVLAPKL